MRPTTQARIRSRESSRSPARWHTISLVFDRSRPGGAPTIGPSTARNRPHDWAERREPVTQCCRSRHRLVLKGCDARKPSPPPAMVAGFSYGRAGNGLSRSAARRSLHSGNRDQRHRPLWGADIPQKAGSTRWNSGFQIRACALSIPSPLGRCRHRVTSRRAGCRPLRACRERTPRRRRHGAACFVRWGSIDGQATGTSASDQVRRRQAFNAQPGPSAGCPDRSTRSPRQKAPSTASAALSTKPTPGAPGRIGPREATVEAAAGRSAMSTVRRS